MMPSSRRKSSRADEATQSGCQKEDDEAEERESRDVELSSTTRENKEAEAGPSKILAENTKSNKGVAEERDESDFAPGSNRVERGDKKSSDAEAVKSRLNRIDALLNRCISDDGTSNGSPTPLNSGEPSDAAGEVGNNKSESSPPSTPKPATRQKKRFSCYNCIILIMDATLLILSLLYPILIKTRSKLTFADDVAKLVDGRRSRADAFAHAAPRSFFHDGPAWRNLLIEDIYDGDLATLKVVVGGGTEWTLVFYYASWDADSIEARDAFTGAATSAVAANAADASSTHGVRFAAINCGWRYGSCKSQTSTKIREFPAVYAYDAQFRGFLYQGSHDVVGYLTFLNRLKYPYRHLASASHLASLLATRDTVVAAYLDASNAAFNSTLSKNISENNDNKTAPFKSFYDTCLHFTQAPHHLSFQFLLVTSPSLAAELEMPAVNTLRVYRASEPSLFYDIASVSAAGLISTLDNSASPASVALVSKNQNPQLVTRLTSTNVSVLLFGPDVRSTRAFYPAYQEFRETGTWFRACGSDYHRSFRHVLLSSDERFEMQRFCCDYDVDAREEEDFFFLEEESSSTTTPGEETGSSYFGPQLPKKREDQICKVKTSSAATFYAAKNISRSCLPGKGTDVRESELCSSPLPPPSSDPASARYWTRRCQRYVENPDLCRRRLTKTAAGVVQDGVLAVPAFAGLACRSNRTFGFRYIVRTDFPEMARRLGIGADEGAASLVILDNEAEETYVLRRVEKSKEIGEFITNFTRKTLAPLRRSRAGHAVRDESSFDRCLKKRTFTPARRPNASASVSSSSRSCILELSSESLRTLMLEEGREFLLLFYTKTCGLCKIFNRYFLRLSKLFRDIPGFRLAQIDVDENDLPINLTVGAVPAIIFFRGLNFSRAFRAGESAHPRQKQQRTYSSRLSLPDLLSFVLRHVTNARVREKLASSLCDTTCLKNNLEDVRNGAAKLKKRKGEIVEAMLAINARVIDAERDMLYHLDRCGGGSEEIGGEPVDEERPDDCLEALEGLKKRVQGFARRLDVKADRLELIQRKIKTYEIIETEIARTLSHQK